MAILAGMDTLYDVARVSGPDGKPMKIVQVLEQKNDILLDAPFYPTNQSMSMVATRVTAEPAGAWIGFNEGGSVEKPSNEQITDSCGMLEAWSEVECKVADLSGNWQKYLEQRDRAFIGGLSKTMAYAFIYNSMLTGNTKAFHGLAPRLSAIGDQVLSGGGAQGDNTSIYCVQWGEDKVHGIYPKDLPTGLQYDFKGKVTKDMGSNKLMDVYRGKYDWYMGLHVVDPKCIVRIANVDVSNLKTAGDSTDTSANIEKLMSLALDALPDTEGNVCFYMNKTVMSMLRVKLMNKSNTHLTIDDWVRGNTLLRRGRMSFMGFPIGRVDQITNAEAVVS